MLSRPTVAKHRPGGHPAPLGSSPATLTSQNVGCSCHSSSCSLKTDLPGNVSTCDASRMEVLPMPYEILFLEGTSKALPLVGAPPLPAGGRGVAKGHAGVPRGTFSSGHGPLACDPTTTLSCAPQMCQPHWGALLPLRYGNHPGALRLCPNTVVHVSVWGTIISWSWKALLSVNQNFFWTLRYTY